MTFHLMTILEVFHTNKFGEILFKKNNLKNTLHTEGEEYILKTLFGGMSLVSSYYLGLDNRSTLSIAQGNNDLQSAETTGPGYSRQQVSNTSFQISENADGNYQANSPIVAFTCSSNSWFAKNIFLTTSPQYLNSQQLSGPRKLISSVPLGTELVVSQGETVSMRIGLSLKTSTN